MWNIVDGSSECFLAQSYAFHVYCVAFMYPYPSYPTCRGGAQGHVIGGPWSQLAEEDESCIPVAEVLAITYPKKKTQHCMSVIVKRCDSNKAGEHLPHTCR